MLSAPLSFKTVEISCIGITISDKQHRWQRSSGNSRFVKILYLDRNKFELLNKAVRNYVTTSWIYWSLWYLAKKNCWSKIKIILYFIACALHQYLIFQVDLFNRSNGVDLSNFVSNGEWQLIKVYTMNIWCFVRFLSENLNHKDYWWWHSFFLWLTIEKKY